jgi:hypothetical protein
MDLVGQDRRSDPEIGLTPAGRPLRGGSKEETFFNGFDASRTTGWRIGEMRIRRDSDRNQQSGFFVEYLDKFVWKIGSAARDYFALKFPSPKRLMGPIAFRAVTFVSGSETETAAVASQGFFLPDRLVVVTSDEKLAQSISITSIFIGSDSCLINNYPLSIALFRADSIMCHQTFPVVSPGITMAITFQNSNPIKPVEYPLTYAIPVKLDPNWKKVKISKRREQCNHLLAPDRRCPFPLHHSPRHEYPPLPYRAPAPQLKLFPVMLGEHLRTNDPRRSFSEL